MEEKKQDLAEDEGSQQEESEEEDGKDGEIGDEESEEGEIGDAKGGLEMETRKVLKRGEMEIRKVRGGGGPGCCQKKCFDSFEHQFDVTKHQQR
jgi:hypothetical protein